MVGRVLGLGLLLMGLGCVQPQTLEEARSAAIHRALDDYDTRQLAADPDRVYELLRRANHGEAQDLLSSSR